jgi:hypothetical protein
MAAPDFGKGGHLVVRASEAGAHVNVTAGEFIRCRITPTGPGKPVFSFACQHRPLWSAEHVTPNAGVYEFAHFKEHGDVDAPADSYALVLAFIGGIQSYTVLMEKLSTQGDVLQTLNDYDASTTHQADIYRCAILLFAV